MKFLINYDDFAKLELRVGQIKESSEVEGSTKLVRLQVNFGDEIGTKTIYAGIKPWYEPEKLVGRKLAFVVNLQPKKFIINGIELESQGMLLAAGSEGKAVLYDFDEDIPAGSVVR